MDLKKLGSVALSILFLSLGWLGATGLTLLVGLIPLLWISRTAEDSRKGWWSVFGYAMLNFVGWNLSTIWWIGFATPVGPVAATLASTLLMMIAFMTFHTVSKKAPIALAYSTLISLWITLEYAYTTSEFSWPWLLLGNGFSNDIWAIQWYEYTGIFGGSLWTLLSNVLIFEALRRRSRGMIIWAASIALTPLVLSILIYNTYSPNSDRSIRVSVIQPNVDCYAKFDNTDQKQEQNIYDLIEALPSNTELVVLPETAIPRYYNEAMLRRAGYPRLILAPLLDTKSLITGMSTTVQYEVGEQSDTARKLGNGRYYDTFNTAAVVNKHGVVQHRHKARLVIGVENTPTWIFKIFRFFVIDLGGVVGQIGKGTTGEAFEIDSTRVGGAICYEGLYGNFFGEFVRDGAEMMTIISNDGWWGNTPGHKHLYTLSAVRAVEHRRAIARSANTGISGFIDSRGVSQQSLEWEEKGALTQDVALHSELTIYTMYGDYIARVMQYIAMLSLLYYVAYRARKKHYLV